MTDDAGRYFSWEKETFPASAFIERRLNETDVIIGRQQAGFNVPSNFNAYLAIEIPHDYSRLPPMNIASARSLHILLKATKEFLGIPATQFPRRDGKARLIKLLPLI